MAVDININLNGGSGGAKKTQNTDLSGQNADGVVNDKVSAKTSQKGESMVLVTMLARNTVNYVIQNGTKWTGRSQMQTSMNNAKTALGFGIAAVKHPIMSAGIAAFQIGSTALNNYVEDKDNRVIAERLRQRAGYGKNNTLNGRRL